MQPFTDDMMYIDSEPRTHYSRIILFLFTAHNFNSIAVISSKNCHSHLSIRVACASLILSQNALCFHNRNLDAVCEYSWGSVESKTIVQVPGSVDTENYSKSKTFPTLAKQHIVSDFGIEYRQFLSLVSLVPSAKREQ